MRRRRREQTHKPTAMRIPIASIYGGVVVGRAEQGLELDALASSIAKWGLLSPVVVRENAGAGRFALVCGTRRLAACRMLGLKEIDALVVEADERAAAACFMEEHVVRLPPACADEAEVVCRAGLAGRYPRLAQLGALPECVRDALRRDNLLLEQAEALLTIRGEREQLEAETIIAGRSLSGPQARRLAAVAFGGSGEARDAFRTALSEIEAMTRRLSLLGVLGGVSMHSQDGNVRVQITIEKGKILPQKQENGGEERNKII